MIGFVSLCCLSINPYIHPSILIVYMAHEATAFLIFKRRYDFLYYRRARFVVSTIVTCDKYCSICINR